MDAETVAAIENLCDLASYAERDNRMNTAVQTARNIATGLQTGKLKLVAVDDVFTPEEIAMMGTFKKARDLSKFAKFRLELDVNEIDTICGIFNKWMSEG